MSNTSLDCFVSGLNKKKIVELIWIFSRRIVLVLYFLCEGKLEMVAGQWFWWKTEEGPMFFSSWLSFFIPFSPLKQRSPHETFWIFLHNHKLQNMVNFLFSLPSLGGTRWFHSFKLSVFYQHMALGRFLGLGRWGRSHSFWSTEHFSCPSQCLQGLRAGSLHQVVGWYFRQSQGVTFS